MDRTTVDTQQVLASLDLLVAFHGGTPPLQIWVAHRGQPSDATLKTFEEAPELDCRHEVIPPVSDGSSREEDALLWRDYAAASMARVIPAESYLVMDASALCIRRFEIQDLLKESKAVVLPMTSRPRLGVAAPAQELNGRPVPPSISCTFPAVLTRKLALQMLDEFEDSRHMARPATSPQVPASGDLEGSMVDTARDLGSWFLHAPSGHFVVARDCDPERMRRTLSRLYQLID